MENIIISGNRVSLKKLNIGIILAEIAFAIGTYVFLALKHYDERYFNNGACLDCLGCNYGNKVCSFLYSERYWQLLNGDTFETLKYAIPIIVLILVITNFVLFPSKISITVADKRIYGIARFGKRVDLPIDSISASALNAFSTVGVATSSGQIAFALIDNAKQVHTEINNLLIARQDKPTVVNAPTPTTNTTQVINPSNADELKKFKDLLDSGVITQDEFDIKKQQLLGL